MYNRLVTSATQACVSYKQIYIVHCNRYRLMVMQVVILADIIII